MQISHYAEEKIKEFEGLRLKAYRCPSGKLTIGWGHTGKIDGEAWGDHTSITMDKAQQLFEQDIERIERNLRFEFFYPRLSDSKLDAVVSFIYNLGFGNFRTSTLRKKMLRDVNDPTIPDEFRRWVYGTNPATGKKEKLRGLVTRREWEAQMYEEL